MPMNTERPGSTGNAAQYRVSGPTSLLGKVVAVVLGTAALVAAFVFSLVLLAVLLTGALVVGGYVWWRTRALRKTLREQQRTGWPAARVRGQVYEGEVLRDTGPGTDGDSTGR
ncbi:MAG: hypothetical protein ABI794_06105 [Betaproteobacteria bacterium]